MFKVSTFNCNSIRARLPIVKEWISIQRPDLLMLQETKVQDSQFPYSELEDEGYHIYVRGQKSYNGVAILSRWPLENVKRWLLEEDEEARFLKGEIDSITFINVYVPQGVSTENPKFIYKLKWLEALLSYVRSHYTKDSWLILAGDFNVALEATDLFDPEGFREQVGFHSEERRILREFLSWGFVDLFRKFDQRPGQYTFWDYRIPNAFKRKKGWRIDYILTTPPLASKATSCWIDTRPRTLKRPSDHTFLIAEFDLDV